MAVGYIKLLITEDCDLDQWSELLQGCNIHFKRSRRHSLFQLLRIRTQKLYKPSDFIHFVQDIAIPLSHPD